MAGYGDRRIRQQNEDIRILRAEANIVRLPLFAIREKFDNSTIQLPGSGEIKVVKMPSFRAKKLMYHIILRMLESKKAFGKVIVPVEFTSEREIRRILGANAVQVREVLSELADARYTAHFAVKVKTPDGKLEELKQKGIEDYEEFKEGWVPFDLIRLIIYKGERYKYKGKEYVSSTIKIFPAQWIVDNIQRNYYRPIAFDLWNSLSPLAQRLYEILTTNFYASKGENITIFYSTLCSLLPIRRKKYESYILRTFGPNFDKLVDRGILNDWWYETRVVNNHLDVLFTLVPGPVILNTPRLQEPIIDSIASTVFSEVGDTAEVVAQNEIKDELPKKEVKKSEPPEKPVRSIDRMEVENKMRAKSRSRVKESIGSDTLFGVLKKDSKEDSIVVKKTMYGLKLLIPDPTVDKNEAESTFQLIKEHLKDENSDDFYRIVAERLPYDVVHEMLSVIKHDEGLNVKNPAAYFTRMVMEYAERHAQKRRNKRI